MSRLIVASNRVADIDKAVQSGVLAVALGLLEELLGLVEADRPCGHATELRELLEREQLGLVLALTRRCLLGVAGHD